MQKKLFVAIDPGDELASFLENYQEGLKGKRGLRLTPSANLHLTVYFIGYVAQDRLNEIVGVLDETSREIGQFRLVLEDIVFAPPGRPRRMIWAVLKDEDGGYNRLHLSLGRGLGAFTVSTAGRELFPHITLARFDNPHLAASVRLPSLQEKPAVDVASFNLMESSQGQDGVFYTPISSFLLS
ncbi:MAG: 2'-5' RNA ligase [Candidatus Colwellbacteria bacterium RBG_13_48_8]|uniref:RNA 2',3'-cyclic phosphodiesterase n=1 Tax=Candidatus Colwellbacteria bacterium RBG_13_48_8 TaxID=1797685 RepID=A0A1G1YVB2_9BACT|nr:MAG: 2'-5' RNA ligase [Candidatus Colwellbacteria bacterium RBG_13_48_8]